MPRDDNFEQFDGVPIDPQSAELQRALVALDRSEHEDEGYTPDIDDSRAIAVVKERDGRDLVADATDPAREFRAVEADKNDDEGLTPPTSADRPEKAAAPVEQAAALDVPALMKAIPAQHREQVQAMADQARQWGEIEAIAAPFADALKQHGETTLDGIRTLASLNSFATQNPGGYMAWFTARAVPQENRAKALIQLGAAVGVKLVEDEFGLDDDEGEKPAPPVDPVALRDQHDVDALIGAFEKATGPNGQAAHPLFQGAHPLSGAVQRAMTKAIAADVQAGKARPATIPAMRAYYDAAVEEITAALPGNNAAQEKVEKAKRASAPVASSPATPRRSNTSTKGQDDDPGGSKALLDGLLSLYGPGVEE